MMNKKQEINRLVTIDEALQRAQQAGMEHMSRKWFQAQIDHGHLDAHQGAITYLREADVVLLIDTAKIAKGNGQF